MKKDVRNAWMISSIIFVTLLVMGCVYHNMTVKKLGNEYVYTLTQCEARVAELESSIVSEGRGNIVDPVVLFNPPGIFTSEEQDLLYTRLINPLVDYYTVEQGLGIFSVIIDKSKIGDYLYGVQVATRGDGKVYSKNGSMGFLFGKQGEELEYWQPQCLGDCDLSDEYLAKYPHILR